MITGVVTGPRFASSKFAAPRLVSCLVARSRLFDELDRGAGCRLTLVVGAPGAGKTTLLANWLAASAERPSAGLGCEPADSDPFRFMTALVEALRHGFGEPDIGTNALELLHIED